MTNTNPPPATREGQLAERAAELLPGAGTPERLELLGAMDPDDMRASLAFIASDYPRVFDFALVRDNELVERLQDRLDHQYDDDPEPYCAACGADIGIFIGHGQDWHHYRGSGTAESPVELYDADHEPALAWRGRGTAGIILAFELGRDIGSMEQAKREMQQDSSLREQLDEAHADRLLLIRAIGDLWQRIPEENRPRLLCVVTEERPR